jgi:hypothetical protein
MLQPLLVGELFGVPSFATVLGLMQLLTQPLSGLGPLALGWLAAERGGYAPGLLALAGIAVASALVLYAGGGLSAPGRAGATAPAARPRG